MDEYRNNVKSLEEMADVPVEHISEKSHRDGLKDSETWGSKRSNWEERTYEEVWWILNVAHCWSRSPSRNSKAVRKLSNKRGMIRNGHPDRCEGVCWPGVERGNRAAGYSRPSLRSTTTTATANE